MTKAVIIFYVVAGFNSKVPINRILGHPESKKLYSLRTL